MPCPFPTAFLVLIILFSDFPHAVQAEEKGTQPDNVSAKLKPIDIDYSTLGGLRYSLAGDPLTDDKDLENLVFPLRDYEATRLLKKSEDSESIGKILGTVGFLGLVTGLVGILKTSSSQQTPFWITAIGGGVSFDIGNLFATEAQTSKFNSVQRYNRFARGEEQVLPQTPQDEKSLLDFNSTPTPTVSGAGTDGKAGKKP